MGWSHMTQPTGHIRCQEKEDNTSSWVDCVHNVLYSLRVQHHWIKLFVLFVVQVVQMMLTFSGALWLGPDSDGLLNYCDAGRPGLTNASGRSAFVIIALCQSNFSSSDRIASLCSLYICLIATVLQGYGIAFTRVLPLYLLALLLPNQRFPMALCLVSDLCLMPLSSC